MKVQTNKQVVRKCKFCDGKRPIKQSRKMVSGEYSGPEGIQEEALGDIIEVVQ